MCERVRIGPRVTPHLPLFGGERVGIDRTRRRCLFVRRRKEQSAIRINAKGKFIGNTGRADNALPKLVRYFLSQQTGPLFSFMPDENTIRLEVKGTHAGQNK